MSHSPTTSRGGKEKKEVPAWIGKGEYWDAKAAKKFEGCDQIFA